MIVFQGLQFFGVGPPRPLSGEVILIRQRVGRKKIIFSHQKMSNRRRRGGAVPGGTYHGDYVGYIRRIRGVQQALLRGRADYDAMKYDYNQLMSRIMMIRNLLRGRPGAAMPPIPFTTYFNDPTRTREILLCYLKIEEWKRDHAFRMGFIGTQ